MLVGVGEATRVLVGATPNGKVGEGVTVGNPAVAVGAGVSCGVAVSGRVGICEGIRLGAGSDVVGLGAGVELGWGMWLIKGVGVTPGWK